MNGPERELREAQKEAAAYRRALDLLRPFMEGTDRTLGDVLRDPEAVALLRQIQWRKGRRVT